jgi:hypothetical protein
LFPGTKFSEVLVLFAGATGFLIGGWGGPKIVRKVPAGPLRVVVSRFGIGLAVRLGLTAS